MAVALRRPRAAAALHQRREARFAWLLILPTVLFVGLFVAVPIVFSFVLSLFSYSVIAPAHWSAWPTTTRCCTTATPSTPSTSRSCWRWAS
jgi:ABC-type sugar transport system permease subunit